MCGILGKISKKFKVENGCLDKSIKSITHRGPDNCGIWYSHDLSVVMAHTRLSIIDLSESGNQPMVDDINELSLVFNGEIYNYLKLQKDLKQLGFQFQSSSDTEVILKSYIHWGEDCVNHLKGMFAFSIYDKKKSKIFMARDRVGEKPLYYYHYNHIFQFASEIKALDIHEKKINRNSMDHYLAFGYVPSNYSIIENCKKLPAGCKLTYCLNTDELKISKYWDIPLYNTKHTDNENSYITKLEYLLEKSVKSQLIADVPVGVLLSGGVDSSLITAMAVRSSKKIKTFSVTFPGYGTYNEKEHARLIADHFKTEHIELEAENIDVSILENLSNQIDEPMADSSIVPTYLLSKLVSEHCKVALGGDGGDELFAGYQHYSRLLWLYKNSKILPKNIISVLSKVTTNFLPIGFKGRNWIQALSVDLRNDLPIVAQLFDVKSRLSLTDKIFKADQNAEEFMSKTTDKSDDLIQRATRTDFKNYLSEDILVKVDRASMLNSLEIRAPFLDTDLVNFAFRDLPSDLKASTYDKKIILKKLSKKILPKDFNLKRKQGFSIPLHKWLRKGEWHDFFYDTINSSKSGIFNKKYINNLLVNQKKGYSNSERLYSLVMFELWVKKYNAYL